MVMDFKSDLLAVQAYSGDLELYAEVLKRIASWDVSESSHDRETVADLFYATLKAIQFTENECIISDFYKDTFAAFDNINLIAKEGKNNASLVLIDFLNELYQRRNSSSKIKISNEDSLVLLSDLEPIKYIFKICDDDGNRYFPVNKLLGNIILDPSFINTKIEPYHINLIQLAVEMYKVTCEDPIEQFEELINSCNLKFIKYLDGTCIRVDTMDMCNFRNNQVMVFYDVKNEKVLIRHEDESYFLGTTFSGKVEAEYNVQRSPIGHFVELNVKGTVIDYSDAIKESPKEFLRLLYEKNCKNVLIEKMIIRKADGRFEPLNPFCTKDRWVVKGQINGREGKVCLPNRFMDCIEEGRLQLFSVCNNHSVIDQISLGLCMILLENKQISIDDLFDDLNENDWIQNSIIKNWASNSDNVFSAIEFALSKYLSDLDYCTKDEDIKTIEFDKGKIRDSLPFSFNLKWVYNALDLPEEPSIFLGTITEEDENLFFIDFAPIANKSLAKINSKDISYISSTDVVLLEGTNFEKECIVLECLYELVGSNFTPDGTKDMKKATLEDFYNSFGDFDETKIISWFSSKDSKYGEKVEKAIIAANSIKEMLGNANTDNTIEVSGNKQKILCAIKELSHVQFYRKYIWVDFGISSGEMSLLRLFSKINKFANNAKSNDKSRILCLDEPDITMHPEWQRMFIFWLCKFLDGKKYDNPSVSFQVFITTHSPILLSDIPSGNALYLDKSETEGEDKIAIYLGSERNCNTFGNNIHTIYHNSFFLNKSTIGEYSRQKINELAEQMPDTENIMEKIDTLGDDIVRRRLRQISQKRHITVDSNKQKRSDLREVYELLLEQRNEINARISAIRLLMERNQ